MGCGVRPGVQWHTPTSTSETRKRPTLETPRESLGYVEPSSGTSKLQRFRTSSRRAIGPVTSRGERPVASIVRRRVAGGRRVGLMQERCVA